MDDFTLEQLMLVAETIGFEQLEYTKLQANLVWVAANGKLDQIGKKETNTDLDKLKQFGLLEVE